jgi:hypothetical protein
VSASSGGTANLHRLLQYGFGRKLGAAMSGWAVEARASRGDDNASFHKSTLIRQLIEQVGCTLLFLPPYSPDLNKIEKFWARLKHYLRKTVNQFPNLWDAVDNAFRQLS